jgi:hypothetical protein
VTVWRISEKRSDRNGASFLLLRGFLSELDAATSDDAVGVWEREHGKAEYGYEATEQAGTLPPVRFPVEDDRATRTRCLNPLRLAG